MNPTEIADALFVIAKTPFDAAEFGFLFAEATDNAKATVSKLRLGKTNKSDLPNGILASRKFHYAPATHDTIENTLKALRTSKKTASFKPSILITSDGHSIAAEQLKSGEPLHCEFNELGKNFEFFLPAAGMERYEAAKEHPIDIAATGRLAKLYDALLKANPDWAAPERRHDMNLFMTRLIFCLFSEDVGIFDDKQFSYSVFSLSGNKGEHARETIVQAFTAMSLPQGKRENLPTWSNNYKYVNGGLFADKIDAPIFDTIAFRYLRDAAEMDWRLINPDIFGSMIQSIADPKARSELGMHYTSVPNIMKVLGPLFLDDLDAAIEKAWDKPAALHAQLERLTKIRVFDPACGSGNFLVIAYREMREREIRILQRLNELKTGPAMRMFSSVSLGQFYGIEITDFAAETAKLALFIAEYQANARFADVFGRMPALLPLREGGRIKCGNALRLDWEEICPPPVEGEEVYIAGNPPFLGSTYQSKEQKSDLAFVFKEHVKNFAALDFVSAWFFKASRYIRGRNAQAALVSTNSICQGQSVAALWPYVLSEELEIDFAHRNFKWQNNASANAAVLCSIIGIRNKSDLSKRIFDNNLEIISKNINCYLSDGHDVLIKASRKSIFSLPFMDYGNKPTDGGFLILSPMEKNEIIAQYPDAKKLIRRYMGSQEVIQGIERYCIWIKRGEENLAYAIKPLLERFEKTKKFRLLSPKKSTRQMAERPFEFDEIRIKGDKSSILIPSVTSERRPYLPVERVGADVISSNLNQVLYDAPDWCIAIIASRLHLVWIATVCGRLGSSFRYSNTLGWNTFPVPKFTAEQLEQLSASARRILKTRYAHYPATIAELYDPDKMPDDLRQVHRENDELLESMYIGRPFRNDTERLEKLFKLYAAKVASKRGSEMIEMVNVAYAQTGQSKTTNALGQRPMQVRAYAARSAQFILLKAPPAAGKSRALMFVALDKLNHQGLAKTIVCVPETSIGGSFRSTDLTSYGFDADWVVEDRWNLCLSGAEDSTTTQKVKAFCEFMLSDAKVLVCTHATFRFGFDAVEKEYGIEAFDDVFLAIDEFHHVSAADNNRLGDILRKIITRQKAHVMAMTGSYFRGDAVPVLRAEDEERFTTITYSYYEQLDGYEYLKALGINYSFYRGTYINGLPDVLDTKLKTIIHIPHRGSAEAFDEKLNEVGRIMDLIGKHVGTEESTGFDLLKTPDGRILKVADLVNDGPEREDIKTALSREIKGADGKRDDEGDKAKVDIIIALGMAKEGFDWIWCEHALTIGYRASLTEIVQIIGRATRDAPNKRKAIFTNLVAEPGVETSAVKDAVNDMLKAISGSLLMEQVLAPNMKFYRREDGDIREPISDDGKGTITIVIGGLKEPPTKRARDICENDMNDLMAAVCQAVDAHVVAPETAPEVATQLLLTDIIEQRYENLSADETEAIRQSLAARMNIPTLARGFGEAEQSSYTAASPTDSNSASREEEDEPRAAPNTLLEMVRRFINVRELDIDLIDSVNAFQERFEVASRSFDAPLLAQVQSAMVAMRVSMSEGEALTLWPRIQRFRAQEGREPNVHASDSLEARMAEALAWLRNQKVQRMREGVI